MARRKPGARRGRSRDSEPRRRTRRKGKREEREAKSEQVIGVVTVQPDGSGRLLPEALDRAPVYVPPEELDGVRSGDRITVRLELGRKGRVRGRLVAKGERRASEAAGILRRYPRALFLEPDPPGPPILIEEADAAQARDGDAVVVDILTDATGRRQARGRVREVLGRRDDPRVQVELAIRAQGLAMRFPDAALSEALAFGAPTQAEAGRRDLTAVPHVTIDGADARDFDDAVAAKRHGDGYRLWVSIADVAWYVRPGSALDDAAAERGTSVYFPHRALPMLPPELSNDLCSLKPEVLRFAITCEMRVVAGGRTQGIEVYPSLIRSHARLTYEQVQSVYAGDASDAMQPWAEALDTLRGAARLLRDRRGTKGAIDLDVAEAQVLVDDTGQAQHVRPRVRLEAHRVIEDLMIAANEAVAEHLIGQERQAVFRVHAVPDPLKLQVLARWAEGAGFELDAAQAERPKVLSRLARELAKSPQGLPGQMLLLRSLAQARYSTDNVGHFALASRAYVHFTSPIRRYPDLLVHRALRALWDRRGSPRGLEEAAHRASLQERRAMEAERAVQQLMSCQVASRNIGRSLSATVVGVHRAGVFVRGDELYVEGLVGTEELEATTQDHWDVIEQEQVLLARRGGQRIGLGDTLKVRLASVDLRNRFINFELEEAPKELVARRAEAGAPRRKGPAKRQARAERGGRKGAGASKRGAGAGAGKSKSKGGKSKSRAGKKKSPGGKGKGRR